GSTLRGFDELLRHLPIKADVKGASKRDEPQWPGRPRTKRLAKGFLGAQINALRERRVGDAIDTVDPLALLGTLIACTGRTEKVCAMGNAWDIAGFLHGFDCGLTGLDEEDMPNSEAGEDKPDNSGNDGQQDCIYRRIVNVLASGRSKKLRVDIDRSDKERMD